MPGTFRRRKPRPVTTWRHWAPVSSPPSMIPRSSAAGGVAVGVGVLLGTSGWGCGSGCGVPWMRAVTGDAAVLVPPGPVAVTTTRIVEPTSAAVRSYVAPSAPGMSVQFAPAASQRCH